MEELNQSPKVKTENQEDAELTPEIIRQIDEHAGRIFRYGRYVSEALGQSDAEFNYAKEVSEKTSSVRYVTNKSLNGDKFPVGTQWEKGEVSPAHPKGTQEVWQSTGRETGEKRDMLSRTEVLEVRDRLISNFIEQYPVEWLQTVKEQVGEEVPYSITADGEVVFLQNARPGEDIVEAYNDVELQKLEVLKKNTQAVKRLMVDPEADLDDELLHASPDQISQMLESEARIASEVDEYTWRLFGRHNESHSDKFNSNE
jgi:hypothetical protein